MTARALLGARCSRRSPPAPCPPPSPVSGVSSAAQGLGKALVLYHLASIGFHGRLGESLDSVLWVTLFSFGSYTLELLFLILFFIEV